MKYMKKSFSKMVPYHSKLITDGIILNANEAPYNPPLEIIEQSKEEMNNVDYNRYPDMDEVLLNEAIAKRYKIDPANISCGVGSDELLDVCFRAVLEKDDIALGFTPSFSMYQVFAELVGAKFIGVKGDDNYLFNVNEMINKIKEINPKLVVVCSPNNPTGQYFSEKEVRKIIESTDALVLLDLAYIDFAEKDYCKISLEYDNVITFKTFSKAMALPSIRCGYCISNKDNIDMINAVKAPYSLSTFSQILAKNAISNFDLYKDKINEIKVERQRLFKELKNLGFIVFNSEANFIYVIMDEKYYDELLNNKIYIRRFDNLHYRITVGSQTENNMLLEVLRCAVQK